MYKEEGIMLSALDKFGLLMKSQFEITLNDSNYVARTHTNTYRRLNTHTHNHIYTIYSYNQSKKKTEKVFKQHKVRP